MKTTVLSFLASIAILASAEANGVVAKFSALQGGTFILTVNGNRVNNHPAENLNLNHLRPGRNNIYIEYFRHGRVQYSENTVFLANGFESSFNIRPSRSGVRIIKTGEYPLRRSNGRGNHGYGYGNGHYVGYHNDLAYTFRDFMFELRNERFDDRKFMMAREYLRGRNLNTRQLNRILNQFTFERTKVDFTVKAYRRLVDKQNLPTVYHQFQFRSSIREINRRLGRVPYHGHYNY